MRKCDAGVARQAPPTRAPPTARSAIPSASLSQCDSGVAVVAMVLLRAVDGGAEARGLHSSTSQLNLSRV